MLDAITLERRGIPAAPIGVEKLVMTTGRGMARIQGFPDFPIAVIENPTGTFTGAERDARRFQAIAESAASQVESILLGRNLSKAGA